MIFGIIMGIWFMAVGVYSFYYAFMMKHTGTLKTGWIVSKSLQLKESRDLPAFIEVAVKKTNIFAWIATVGGFVFIAAVVANFFILMLLCMLVLIGAYIWYSTGIRNAERQYLTPGLNKKKKRKR